MSDSDISKLEQRIDELIALTEQLSNENNLMRERQDILVEERARLIEKAELKDLESFGLFDVYQGKGSPIFRISNRFSR